MKVENGCSVVDGAALAERYVAGTLPEAECVAFEDHFLACAVCQGEIAFASAARDGVQKSAGRDVQNVDRARVRRIAAVAAIAAGIVAVISLRSASSPSRAVVAELAALGSVAEAPVYLGVAVRGAPALEDSAFDRAMMRYAARDYSAAAAAFRAAIAAAHDSVPGEFFLGASDLFSNDARGAAESFAAVIAHGDTPYRDEAQLYQAKALLRLGRGADAITVLTSRKPADPALAENVRALADSISRAMSHAP